jgi:hypothetical protein
VLEVQVNDARPRSPVQAPPPPGTRCAVGAGTGVAGALFPGNAALSDAQHEDFQNAIRWFSGTKLPDGRVLGNSLCLYESDGTQPIIDTLRRCLGRSVEMTGIELGCGEGGHTVRIAPLLKRLTCVEVRPANIVALLTRLFLYDIHNVDVRMGDVSVVGADWGRFDVLIHVGLLYHFINPVAHLMSLKGLASSIILRTHYGHDALSMPRLQIEHAGRQYSGYEWKEQGWSDPWSGVAPVSCWLSRDDIIAVLREVGYTKVEVVGDAPCRGLPLITIFAAM